MLSPMAMASDQSPRKIDEYWPDAFNTEVTRIVKYRKSSFFELELWPLPPQLLQLPCIG